MEELLQPPHALMLVSPWVDLRDGALLGGDDGGDDDGDDRKNISPKSDFLQKDGIDFFRSHITVASGEQPRRSPYSQPAERPHGEEKKDTKTKQVLFRNSLLSVTLADPEDLRTLPNTLVVSGDEETFAPQINAFVKKLKQHRHVEIQGGMHCSPMADAFLGEEAYIGQRAMVQFLDEVINSACILGTCTRSCTRCGRNSVST
eukprot:CAMPEP_0167786680 /NCGR_PEP_ID=MMETSP0111_2-20121227/8953_1 /TAXON_ID=91324 /ORGANISM="Lotharella globosa, Strain CCCM811" /LENGTH=202 /DNA_ID=CAMNT_0007678141 /DNA_START=335 /DNA_END=943 /DNA_ORIENTATION=-